MKGMKIVLVLIVVLLLSSVAGATVKDDLLVLINQERSLEGRDPLDLDNELGVAAQAHSVDMLANGYFDHDSQDGTEFWERLQAAGFTGSPTAENIGWHTGVPNAQTIFDAWKGSPGHYANMISPNYNFIGIGVDDGIWNVSGTHSSVWTLDFGHLDVECSDGETRQCGLTDTGECSFGTQTCSGVTWGACVGAVYPVAEVCWNGADEDCDGNLDNGCCVTHSYFSCYNNDVYWYDSCDDREEKKEECGSDGCNNNECVICEDEASVACYNNDVYWYDSCGNRRSKKEECYPTGCDNGECIVCESHAYAECTANDIYWYDSCGNREEKKEECGVVGCCCVSDTCNPPPCEDEDDDGFTDAACGGEDCDDTNAQVYPGSVEICNGVDEDCNIQVDDGCRENLIVVSPEQTADLGSRRVAVQLDIAHLDGKVFYQMPWMYRERVLCYKTDCQGSVYLKEGPNQLDVWFEDLSGQEYTTSFNLNIDSRKPRISRQSPRSYTSGVFEAQYTEDFPQDLNLYIAAPGSEDFNLVAARNDCEAGRNKKCQISYDVAAWNGQEIEYFFELWDKASYDRERVEDVMVDTVAPDLTVLSVERISDRYEKYRAEIEVNEKAKVQYSAPGEKTRTICTSCTSSSRTIYFKEAQEYVDIVATDKAGNQDSERFYL